MDYDMWVGTTNAEIKGGWGTYGAHFAGTDAGRYCAENDIAHTVTQERSPRIDFMSGDLYYRVELPDLADDHHIWLKMKGFTLCRKGEKPPLKVSRKDEMIRLLPQNQPSQNWFYERKPSSK